MRKMCTSHAMCMLGQGSHAILRRNKESFIWSEHAQLYENEQEETKNSIVETPGAETAFRCEPALRCSIFPL